MMHPLPLPEPALDAFAAIVLVFIPSDMPVLNLLVRFDTMSAELPLSHSLTIRVRYAETDGQGFLHHANYPIYYEMGRTELFRAQGGSYREFEAGGYFLVVASMDMKFRAPARYDDELTLTTRLRKLTPAKLVHGYELTRGDTLVATAESLLACLDQQGRVQRLSDVLPNYEQSVELLRRAQSKTR